MMYEPEDDVILIIIAICLSYCNIDERDDKSDNFKDEAGHKSAAL